ncbi:MAG: DUF86 domain-containing protein [Candidatus Paceibacterota bacterium]|jgi:uncharacterized protein YutE (UPF0331/DUF86 family)
MSNKIVLENMIGFVRKYLTAIARYRTLSQEEIVADETIRGAVERYLYLMAQSTIDLAEAVVAYKRLRKPTTLSETFYVLDENNVIPHDLSERLVKMVGFRNVIAHDYVKVNYDILYDVLTKRYRDIEEFVEIIETTL